MSNKVRIQFTNNNTGKNENIEVPANGHEKITDDLLKAGFDRNGKVSAVQFVGNFQGVTATVKHNGQQIGEKLTDKNTYTDIKPPVEVEHLSIETHKG